LTGGYTNILLVSLHLIFACTPTTSSPYFFLIKPVSILIPLIKVEISSVEVCYFCASTPLLYEGGYDGADESCDGGEDFRVPAFEEG